MAILSYFIVSTYIDTIADKHHTTGTTEKIIADKGM